MDSIGKVVRLTWFQVCKNLYSLRAAIVACMTFVFVFSALQPVRELAADYGYGIAPYAFVFLMNDTIPQMVLMIGGLFLLANAPFEDELGMYIVYRAGRVGWVNGGFLYLIVASFLYCAWVLLASVVSLVPDLEFSAHWGEMWDSLASLDIGGSYAISFEVSNQIRAGYTPLAALGQTFLLSWGCLAAIGALVYAGNRMVYRYAGSWIGAGLVLLDLTIYNMLNNGYYQWSPLSLAHIESFVRSTIGFTFTRSMTIYAAIFALLLAGCCAYEKLEYRLDRC